MAGKMLFRQKIGDKQLEECCRETVTDAVPQDLIDEELITYPVSFERLDVYTQFLVPGRCRPRRHRTAETTELMLQLVAAKRGISVVPDWLLHEEGMALPLQPVRLGEERISKSIHLGIRKGEGAVDYLAGFLATARDGWGSKDINTNNDSV
ncbi:LysR substrate-binding domain-containing protein [Shinella sp.]|uniref:LysR substrate-binding domain-containing protein n=1 Tax=Shinella sp. TaxID=1870904 RepID=UPI00301E3F32